MVSGPAAFTLVVLLPAALVLVAWGGCRQNGGSLTGSAMAGAHGNLAPASITPASITPASITPDTIRHHDRTHYRFRTPSSTFLLDSASGGLSSMIDADGGDWIAYRPTPWDAYPASAASSYRGVPNLVFRGAFGGAGHPGHDRARTRVTSDSTAEAETPGGPWRWTWTFRDASATLDVTGVSDTAAYWFLYEGPAGGTYRPRETYMASDRSAPAYLQLDHYAGQAEVSRRRWYYFGSDATPRVLYIRQHAADTLPDHYSLLGDDTTGIRSPDGMVVAGFGRAPGARPVLRSPHRFTIGFVEGEGASAAAYAEIASRLRANR